MTKTFEVGKVYDWGENGYDPVKVVRRTAKTIWVQTCTYERPDRVYSMRVRLDEHNCEYVVDCTAPKRWRWARTCSAAWQDDSWF